MKAATKSANITQEQANAAVRAYQAERTRTRRRPYTEIGIRRVPCIRCGEPSAFQWNICALPGFHGVCLACDVALNRTVLAFMRVPDAERIGDEYERSKAA